MDGIIAEWWGWLMGGKVRERKDDIPWLLRRELGHFQLIWLSLTEINVSRLLSG